MGGMVAEEIFFGEASTGPSGDLSYATRLAAQMVGSYGMAGSLISLDASHANFDIVSKALSDDASRKALEGLLQAARDGAREVLEDKTHVVEALRDALLERDELIGDEIAAVIELASAAAGTNRGDVDEVIDIRSAVLTSTPRTISKQTEGHSQPAD
jgi:ATP-dependent Zn protease